MTDHGLAGSKHFIFDPNGESLRYELCGVSLRLGAYELIREQLQLTENAADEGVAVRHLYQLEGVLLTLLRYHDISESSADRLREFIRGKLSASLAAMVSVP